MPVFSELAPLHVGALKNTRTWVDIHTHSRGEWEGGGGRVIRVGFAGDGLF